MKEDSRPPQAQRAVRTDRTTGTRRTAPTPSASPAHALASATTARPPSAARLRKEQSILNEAEAHFAQFGFEGASLENIAAAAGISRHNLLYYFASKELLYQRVLDDVLTQWLAGMDDLAQSEDPITALRGYIRAKLRYSRERPNGAKAFTKEVIAGAPRYGQFIQERVGPLLAAEVRSFERWALEGRVARINFTHLMFIIWAVTQAYADQEAQFAILLGRPQLIASDYQHAEDLIVRMVLGALNPDAPVAATAA